ncbi:MULTISPECIES: hypothetical protein [Serratia]|uniref:hypothetical protein n=1 Tax=Serratia TaxID=613 RepID=UPI000ADE85A7|nr:hypothetical protein [Serratia sp. 506_PEND]
MTEDQHIELRIEHLISSIEEYMITPNKPSLAYNLLPECPEVKRAGELLDFVRNGISSFDESVEKFRTRIINHFSHLRRKASFVRLIRSKMMCSLYINSKLNSARSPRHVRKSAKSKSSSNSSRGNDPADPDPERSYSSLFPLLNQVIEFLIFIYSFSFMPFIAASTSEVAK